jgi:dihydrofolate reductase
LVRKPKDVIVYGGAGFVTSLIEHALIDEFHFFMNPVTLGEGMRVFTNSMPLRLRGSTSYECGVVVSTYVPA